MTWKLITGEELWQINLQVTIEVHGWLFFFVSQDIIEYWVTQWLMVEDYKTFMMPLFGFKKSVFEYVSNSKHPRSNSCKKKLFGKLIKSFYVFF